VEGIGASSFGCHSGTSFDENGLGMVFRSFDEIIRPAATTGGLSCDAQGFLAAVYHLGVSDEKLEVFDAVSSTRRRRHIDKASASARMKVMKMVRVTVARQFRMFISHLS
jgi:hypothetical protein